MYAIIVGGGKVGYYLAKELLDNAHEVLIIEVDATRCSQITDELGDIVMRGDGCEAATQEKAGAARADMVISLTGDDEDNLVACQVAKHRFNVPRTIARVNNPRNEAIFRTLGIDLSVSATGAIMAQIEQELPTHPVIPLLTLKGSGLELVGVKIPANAVIAGKRIRDILLPHQSLISLIIDPGGQPRIPTADTVIRENDELVAITTKDAEEALRGILTSLGEA